MRVLFCEDQAVLRKLIALSMRDAPHEYRIAEGGVEALETVREWKPDVLFTDVAMPGMGGLELAARLRADPELEALRIVFMTASTHLDDAGGGGDPPVLQLRKPFGPAALREMLVVLERDLRAVPSPSEGDGQRGGANQPVMPPT
jgi:CheY-like chemotaxis protein